jgi:hypothetical protein
MRQVRRIRRGLTLAEALIALMICAALLACMAVAFSAAGSAFEMNDHFYRSLQQARSGMDLMMTEIRRCNLTSSNAITVTATTVTLPSCPDFGGHSITFTYNTTGANADCITLTDNNTGITSILVGENPNDTLPVDVSSASFSGPAEIITSGNALSSTNPQYVNGSVSLTMTVQLGRYPTMNEVILSGSSAPRASCSMAFQ